MACTSPSQEQCPKSRPSATSCGPPHNEEIDREIKESERLVQSQSLCDVISHFSQRVTLPPADSHSQVLLLVFRWLNTAELCRVSQVLSPSHYEYTPLVVVVLQVCHCWRRVAHHPDLWRILSLREAVVTSKVRGDSYPQPISPSGPCM